MNPLSLNPSSPSPVSTHRAAAAYGAASGRPAETASTAGGGTPRPSDQVELSPAALNQTDTSPIRLALVQRVREQIAQGTYETPDKLVIAAEGLRREVNLVA
jgi:anti-sigma28 factor (negative regulator of flagellin synthesis)